MIHIWQNKSLESLDNEIWKNIPNYEGHYMVSNMGRIKALKRTVNHKHSGYLTMKERILSAKKLPSDYIEVNLAKDGVHKMKLVHRLVANEFIPNPFNLREVNHTKGIKWDNRTSELEWSTASDNQLHSYRVLDRHKPNLTGKLNPNYGNYKLYLNTQTGIFYTTKELLSYFDKSRGGLNYLKIKGDAKLNDFIKV